MCERSAKVTRVVSTAFAVVLSAASVVQISGQGGDGRSDSVHIPSTAEESGRLPSRGAFRTSKKPTPRVSLPETGRLAIRVNEGNSRLQVFRLGSDVPVETIDLPEIQTSLIVRNYEVGVYSVSAKKPGFHDEDRLVEIERDGSRRVSILLRPKLAILSIASNVTDAKISIEGLGEFERPVEKAFVKPGRYRVRVSRRGYVSRSLDVDLKIPGSEEIVKVILEPLRVDAVLDRAFEQIKIGRLEDAEAYAEDVLALNRQHARANLALGMVLLHRADTEKAVDRILQALDSGETFVLPILVRSVPADSDRVSAVIKLDSRRLAFESSERAGLNFSISRSAVDLSEIAGDSLFVSGRTDFHGRPIDPKMWLNSPLETVGCRSGDARRTCTSDVLLLKTLISEWRKP